MTTMMDLPPWVLEKSGLRARAVRRRRCLILLAVMALVIIAGALGL